ncbi:hypothetical protein E5347_11230 [Clostridium sartagoforme]|uniref:Uncharacterized protein n=1 Tax=Clostridium sartagoforme TaxID=84031 RepID=A0A4S2DLL4_9CLOT|nr:hypothetical protein [Clostridium sartagoforme]TGY41881.1 hypothetical protein E5347_11230 [Clostridium sartagoforme]
MARRRHHRRRGRAAADFFGGRRAEEARVDTSTGEAREAGEESTTQSREELLKELGIINLSLETVQIIVFATLLNLYYVYSLRAQTIDALCDTDLSDNFIDTTNFPRITNDIFLYTTGVFLILNYTLFQESACEHKDDLDNKEVGAARRSFLASLFTFLAVTLSRNNLEL